MSRRLHVVAGALVDGAGRVLIQRRADDAHQGGLWEFPGGKLEPGEGRREGLQRELGEELGVETLEATPLIAVCHDYPDLEILLDVWRVHRWRGEPRGREAQPLAWAASAELAGYRFPAADRPVLRALSLPARCLVTPPPGARREAWLEALAASVTGDGPRLVQIRAPGLGDAALRALGAAAVRRVRAAAPSVRILVNGDVSLAMASGADGVHLNARRLWQLGRRPLPDERLLGVSCHDAADLARAAAVDADFAFLGPVSATASHPGSVPLGWECFRALCRQARLPVYAIGGMQPGDEARARECGGQGIAAIRGLWRTRA